MTPARRTCLRLSLLVLLLPYAGLLLPGCAGMGHSDFKKVIWVTRWDYRTADDVATIIDRCADSGFDTVMFQVRGNGTTFYPSAIEPWAEEFDHRDPGFDALDIACRRAGQRNVTLHAWVNAVPGWRGITPPKERSQLYHQRPEWFLYDQNGKRQALKDKYYVALNPCWPEVREYVASLCAEVAGRYPVAGVHLDYIRFLERDAGHSYPRDARTRELFRSQTGLSIPARATDDELPAELYAQWEQWKIDQVTELVRTIRARVNAASPGTRLTAAVMRTPAIARAAVLQDWPRWLHEDLVDAVFPMQYDDNDARFDERVRECLLVTGEKPIYMGIGVYKHADPAQTMGQIESAMYSGCDGVCLFAYASFWESPGDEFDDDPPPPELRRARREQIIPWLRSLRW